MNFLNGARWISGVFTGVLNWTPSTARTITLPDDSVTLLGDDRPIGLLNSGVSVRGYEPIVSVTATKTLALSDCGTVQNCTNAAVAVITIPLNSAVPFPIGARIIIRKTTAQTVTIAWPVGVTVLNFLGATLTVTSVTSYNALRQTSIDTWISYPDLPESTIGGAIRTAIDTTSARTTIGLSNVTNIPLAEPRVTVSQIGTNAGISNTTGTNWIAVGINAGQNNTASNWAAIGTNAGRNNTSGTLWTAIGSNAGSASVATSNWTAIGASAGQANTAGGFWTAIGSGAGQSNTNSGYWTAIGTNAGQFNTGGGYWTAIGSNTALSSTNGGYWTAIGSNAGASVTTASNWTTIGSGAGQDLTTGDSNTIIGFNTGRGVTTGIGNTVVGANVVGLATSLSNNVILASGNGVIKLQIDSTGLATLPITPVLTDSSNLVATTAFVTGSSNALVSNLSKVRYLFVLAGESNSGGMALNSTLTSDQLLAQNHLKIWNNTTSTFQPLQIGTNNLISHTGLTDNIQHGIERGIAMEVLEVLQYPEAYIVKSGQGGSKIAEWSVGNATNYLSTLTTRYNAARTALVNAGFTVRPVLIWFQGINDAIGGTATATWRTATQAHFTQIRSLMGASTPIFMPLIMPTSASYIAINTEINTIDTADTNMWALPTSSITENPANNGHYTANGYLRIARAFVDSFRNSLGVPGSFTQGNARHVSSNPAVVLKRAAVFSIANNTLTTIPFDTIEIDTDNLGNISNGSIVISPGSEGIYTITAMATTDIVQSLKVQIIVNSVTRAQSPLIVSTTNTLYSSEVTRIMRFNSGDTVTVGVIQSNSGATNVNTLTQSEFMPTLSILRVGR